MKGSLLIGKKLLLKKKADISEKKKKRIKELEKEVREYLYFNNDDHIPNDILKKIKELNYHRNKMGLATYAQIKPLKELSLPDDPSPQKQKIVCRFCGSQMPSPDPSKDEVLTNTCPNCKATNAGVVVGLNDNQPSPEGKQNNPFSTNDDMYVPQGNNINSSNNYNKLKHADIKDKKEEKNKTKAKETYEEEFYQCIDPNELSLKDNDDDKINEIERSCKDLAIDN